MEAAYETVVFLAYVRDTQSIGFVNEQGSTSFCLSLKSNWNSGPEARRMPRLPPSSSLPVGRILFNPCIFTRATSRGIPRKKGRSALLKPVEGEKKVSARFVAREPPGETRSLEQSYEELLPSLFTVTRFNLQFYREDRSTKVKKKKKKKIRGARLELYGNRINL